MIKVLGWLVVLVIIWAVYSSSREKTPVAGPVGIVPAASESPLAKERELWRQAKAGLDIKDFRWSKDYGVMIVSFTFDNRSDFDVKDFKVVCEHSAPSGTRIDSNTRTIYEAVPARSRKPVKEMNLGFIHSQATRSGCEITDFVLGQHRPAPPKPAPKTSGPPLSIKPQ